jgi:hypothetical protein
VKVVPQHSPLGTAIFCDDIREEVRGKVSLIGVYSGVLTIAAPLPILLPRFCIRVTYLERPGESDEPVEIRVYLPHDDDVATVRQPLDMGTLRKSVPPAPFEGSERFLTSVVHVELSPFPIQKAGLVRVRAYRGDLEVRLGSLEIQSQPPAPPEGHHQA